MNDRFPGPFARLIDRRCGILRSVSLVDTPPGLPPGLFRAEAAVADSSRFCAWHSDDRAGGLSFDDPEAALLAAAGEGIERYCGNLVPDRLHRASFGELEGEGRAAIDPQELALFSASQYRSRGFPFVPMSRDLRQLWTPGRSLHDGGERWVPASLVWVTFGKDRPTRGEPKTHPTPYAGVATGASREQAELAALCELFERDAVALAWHRGDALPRLQLPPALRARLWSEDLDPRFFLFPSDFGIPVIGCLAHDRRLDHLALGLACRPDAWSAATKAAAEAVQLLLTCRILDDPQSPFLRQVAAGAPGLGVKPWRADRAYHLSYRSDWHDVWDLLSQLQLYFDPEMRARLERRLGEDTPPVPLERVPLERVPSVPGDRDALLGLLAARGYEAVAVDLTTPEVASTGLVVVRVVVPGLYGNSPAAFPYLGGPRLALAEQRGEICHLPLPYA